MELHFITREDNKGEQQINNALSFLITHYKQDFLKEAYRESRNLHPSIDRRTENERLLSTGTG